MGLRTMVNVEEVGIATQAGEIGEVEEESKHRDRGRRWGGGWGVGVIGITRGWCRAMKGVRACWRSRVHRYGCGHSYVSGVYGSHLSTRLGNAITLDGEVSGKQVHVSNTIHVVLGIKVPRHGRREVPSPRHGQRCSQ